MGKDKPKQSSLTSGKVAIFQLSVPLPPGMSDQDATEWLCADIQLSVGLVQHMPLITIGTAPAEAIAVPGGPRLTS